MLEFDDLECMCADEQNTGRLLDDIGITSELTNINVPTSENAQPTSTMTRQPVMTSTGSKTTVIFYFLRSYI